MNKNYLLLLLIIPASSFGIPGGKIANRFFRVFGQARVRPCLQERSNVAVSREIDAFVQDSETQLNKKVEAIRLEYRAWHGAVSKEIVTDPEVHFKRLNYLMAHIVEKKIEIEEQKHEYFKLACELERLKDRINRS